MLHVTWEWIGLDEAALDVANTVAVEKGVERDLLATDGRYEAWAAVATTSPSLDAHQSQALGEAHPRILELREHIRAVLHATAAARPLPETAVAALNGASRAAPRWPELTTTGELSQHTDAGAVDRLIATYARSAMEVAHRGGADLRVCGAPSCGMFYRPRRRQQRWCSEPCGNRARFARHYASRGAA
jgi:predicted RNA-binding Zn ribbon-like protein